MSAPEKTNCQRCDGCVDCDHHWLPNPDFGNDDDQAEHPEAEYVCKHCPALGQECDACDGEAIVNANYQDETGEMCLGCNGLGVIPLKTNPHPMTTTPIGFRGRGEV